ncbi:MAG: endonuclease/exonuclease/phosphatase family protein [Bacteroidota bacterium]
MSVTTPPPKRRWRPLVWLFVFVQGVVLPLALVGGLAAYLHPQTFWWAQLVAIGLPYWTALLVLFTLTLLLAKQRGWALAYAVISLWLLARTLPLGWLASPPDPAPDDLVLLTFNTPISGAIPEVLLDGTRTFFEDTAPTIAGLQEVVTVQGRERRWLPNHIALVADSLDYLVPMPPLGTERTVDARVPLLIHPAASEVGFETLSQSAFELFPDEEMTSEVFRTHFRWQGREGVHYNVHLVSFGIAKPWTDGVPFYSLSGALGYLRQYRDAYRRRAAHVEAIRAMLAQETLPVLISGDFNATPYNWSVRQLSQGRTDAFRTTGRGWGATYRADLPVVRIDFVFADPAWEVVRAEVPSLFLSDHKPLLVRLRWAEPE